MNLITKNFTEEEVIHSGDLPEELRPIAFYVLGYMQSLRDAISGFHNKEVRIIITSGYRDQEHNDSVGGSNNSYHIWRYQDNQPVWAVDIKSPDITEKELYDYCSYNINGEVYWNQGQGIIHLSSFGPHETWIRRQD